MPDSGHVGLTALDAERAKLLATFDQALSQGLDDPVKTEHGNIAESAFRDFLKQFLPRKYGVTKGHSRSEHLPLQTAPLTRRTAPR